MKDTLTHLQDINRRMDAIGERMRREAAIYEAELAERQRMGLTGKAAIKHYNDWMQKYNLPIIHFCTESP